MHKINTEDGTLQTSHTGLKVFLMSAWLTTSAFGLSTALDKALPEKNAENQSQVTQQIGLNLQNKL